MPLNLLQAAAQVGAQQVAHARQLAQINLHQQLQLVAVLQQVYLLLLQAAGAVGRRGGERGW